MIAKNHNNLWAGLIIEECVRHGVTTFCVCPGSRSTPLTVAAARHPGVRIVRAYDERGAGFWALGHARATGKPAPVITTSGSAVAQLYPAVVEAHQDAIPLLLLTADRPPELIDTGANQAILQNQFFAPHGRWQFDLPCPTPEINPAMVLTTVDQALAHGDGPVHLNCRFREPFMGPEDVAVGDIPALADWHRRTTPWTDHAPVRTMPVQLASVIETIHAAQRGLLLVGRLHGENAWHAVRSLALKLNWPVYADLRSGLRLEVGTHVMRYFDQERLTEAFNAEVKPDVVLHLGTRVVSKRVPLFFHDNPPRHYIHVDASPERQDPIHGVTQRLVCDIAGFADQVTEQGALCEPTSYLDRMNGFANRAHDIIHAALDAETTLTEPHVANSVTETLPVGHALYVANSMPVRDVDIYGTFDRLEDFPVGVNRGASGIDGTVASALGFAQGHGLPTTLMIGDQAFIHDLNSLSLVREIDVPLVIVVINNGGGGIFHFLPIAAETDVFEPYFKMPHDFRFKGVCDTFGLAHVQAQDKEGFARAYGQALKEDRSTVIEVVTDSHFNHAFRKMIKEQLLEMLLQES